jgi:hypothetical protein
LPRPVKCEYEKIRDDIIAQRRWEWAVLEKQWEIDVVLPHCIWFVHFVFSE